MVDVSIIIVNYKTAHLILSLLDSIYEKSTGFSFEVIIVDNSMSEEELLVLNNYSKIRPLIVSPKENLGFGKANNLGALKSKGKYLLFLNPDTLLINNAIFELFSFLENNPQVGIVGSNLYTKDLKPNHSFFIRKKNIRNEKKEIGIIRSVIKFFSKKRKDFNYSYEPLKIDGFVCGASLMIKKDNFEKLNGFDRRIFMYAEESLICYRLISELHLDIYNIPSSMIIHLEGASYGFEFSQERAKNFVDGNYVYYQVAFGDELALKYLKTMKRINYRKMVLFFLFHKKKVSYRNLANAFNNKVIAISKVKN